MSGQAGPMYRKCPVCSGMMTRRNHGRTSGVIIDTCPDHGVWFDPAELSKILAWIEAGGEIQAKKFQAKEVENNAQVRSSVSVPMSAAPRSSNVAIGVVIVELLAGIFS
jgi:Zn-finger nucleic acid-binding protein